MNRNTVDFLLFVAGIVAIGVAATMAAAKLDGSWGGVIVGLAVLGYLLVILAWVALVDSKKCWPEKSAWGRARAVLSFTRPPSPK